MCIASLQRRLRRCTSHRNCFPLFCRVITVIAPPVFRHCHLKIRYRAHRLSVFAVTFEFLSQQWWPVQNSMTYTKMATQCCRHLHRTMAIAIANAETRCTKLSGNPRRDRLRASSCSHCLHLLPANSECVGSTGKAQHHPQSRDSYSHPRALNAIETRQKDKPFLHPQFFPPWACHFQNKRAK